MNLEIIYIPGDGIAFQNFIAAQGRGVNANLTTIDGNMRWVITREDGTRYIARPEEAMGK